MKISEFIDLHTHGLGDYGTKTADPYEILKMAESHGRAGTAAILPTIYLGPIDDMRRGMAAVRKAMELQSDEKQSLGNVSAAILGVHLEGPFLNPAKCGSLSRMSFAEPTISGLNKLLNGYKDLVKIITMAPELPGALKVIERCAGYGIRVNMGHSDATFDQAAAGKKAGARGVTHIFNAMRPFHHREPGLAGLALLDEDLYIEVIADGVHLHPRTLDIIFNTKRLDRIMLVSDSVKSRGPAGKAVYDKKGILAGGAATLSGSVSVLKKIGVPDAEIVEASRDNPARYIASDLAIT